MLLGRAGELADVTEALAERVPILLMGEAGIGKSALMRAAAGAQEVGVLEGGGLAMLAWKSYLPISRALGEEPPLGDQARIAGFVREAVGDQVLILDDLHWADEDTLALLPFLTPRVRLISAVRCGDPATEQVRVAAEGAGFAVKEIGALGHEDAVALVHARRPGVDETAVTAIVEHAGGNPLLLEELSGGSESVDTLRLTLSARLQSHSESARETVARLALFGRPVPRELVDEPFDELVAAGLVVASNGNLELRHPLLGEAALEGVDPTQRGRLHAEIARSASDPGEAARHHAAAGERELAFRTALEATERAAWPGERARHLAIAAHCAPDEKAVELHLRAAAELIEAGDFPAARELAEAVDSDRSEDRAEAALLRGRSDWYLGQPEVAMRHLEHGAGLVAGTGTWLEARLLQEQARVLVWEWDTERALPLAARALEIVRETGAPERWARFILSAALYAAGSADCLGHLRASLEEARRGGDAALECEATAALISFLHAFEESTDAAYRLALSVVGRGKALGLESREAEFCYVKSHLELERGDYTSAITNLSELLADPLPLGQNISRARALLALAFADTGQLGDAQVLLREALADARTPDAREVVLWTRGEIEWLSGSPRQALAAVDECLQENPHTHLAAELEVVRGWALFDLGRRERPSAESCYPLLTGAHSEARATWLMAKGDTGTAQRLFDEAAGNWHGRSLRSEVRCHWGEGEAARRSGDLAGSQRRLLHAEECAEAHGLLPLLGRIRRSLRAVGVRRSAPHTRASGSLTAREHVVMALVADGLSSAQIAARLGLARSTVESQVRSAKTKLRADTRLEAALLAAGERTD